MRLLVLGVLVYAAVVCAVSIQDGTNVQVWPCEPGSVRQQWTLPNENKNILLKTNQKCIDISNYGTAPGSNVWVWDCHNSDKNPKHQNQAFTDKGGELVADFDGACLSAFGSEVANNVVMMPCHTGGFAQDWEYSSTDSTWRLKANTSLCLDAGTSTNCSHPNLKDLPYCNQNLPVNERVADLVSRMTLSEKIQNLQNENPGVPRLGVPALKFSECLHGVLTGCGAADGNSTGCPTSFPCGLAMGATFNRTLFRRMGEAISTEGRALNNQNIAGLAFWAPDINLFRDPRWGRGQEVPGEDPFLTSQYVMHYSRGLQEGDDPRYLKVVSTCKHFSAYDLENWHGVDRFHFDANVTTQDLVEFYLVAFHACVTQAHAQSIMCSYNSVNGVPSCANGFLNNEVIRKQWQFDGFMVSDCGAINCIYNTHHYANSSQAAVADGIRGGCDLNCGSTYAQWGMDAVSGGLMSEGDVDQAITRVYRHLFMLGEMDSDVSYKSINSSAVDSQAHRELALQAAREAMVLLKNDKSVLPLSAQANIAFVGPHANATQDMLSNYHGTNTLVNSHSPFQVATRRGLKVSYSRGCDIGSNDTSGFADAIAKVKAADVAVVFVGLDQTQESEGHDRTFLELPGAQTQLIQAVVATGKPTVVVLIHGGPLAIEWTKAHVPAILDAFYPGELGGDAIVDVLSGDFNPGGKLPYTYYPATYISRSFFDMNLRNNGGVTYRYYTGEPLFKFGFGLSYTTFRYEWVSTPGPEALSMSHITDEHSTVGSYVVTVTNTGKVAGDAVALAFVNGTLPTTPQTALFGFERVHLKPGGSTQVFFSTPAAYIAQTDEQGTKRVVPGVYEVTVGEVDGRSITHTFTLTGKPVELSRFGA